ncbi:glycosyltransferase family 2 protein [Erythrobacter donghaensis]|uniref:glycosyltransferase family 2 protein n=1 Tax=Erythrobacter donghaensis TaxID=267135 RepID=UPI001FEB4B3A|nr:glycosyltransferase family 2 protein [Erythrobacter donghaensis]
MHTITGSCALSVVIPVYNEEAGLDALVARVTAAAEAIFADDFELVLVNDGSKDGSWGAICRHADADPRIVAIDLARNHGHQLALTAGLNHVRGELVFVLDADLQDPPELLGPMLAKVREGYDVVYGQRVKRHGETAFKRGTASLFYRMLGALVDTHIPRDTGDFRLMTRRVVDQLNAMPERYRFIRGLVSYVGFNQIAFPYERDARFAGETHYPLSKMVALAVDAVTSFSTVPLRFASHLGMLFGVAGLLSLVGIVWVWLQGGTVQGWASLAALILIMGSVQLLVLGVFGEYLGRMYMEAKHRPLFIIAEVRRHPVAVAARAETEADRDAPAQTAEAIRVAG